MDFSQFMGGGGQDFMGGGGQSFMGGGGSSGGMMGGGGGSSGGMMADPMTLMWAALAAKDTHGLATGRYGVDDVLLGRQLEYDLEGLGDYGQILAAGANPFGYLMGKIF